VAELSTEIAEKAPSANPVFTGIAQGVTAARLGLGSASNTSDADKGISAATQTELDKKDP